MMPCNPPIRSRASSPSFTPTSGDGGRDRVVVLCRDPHEARRLGSSKTEREGGPERYRHLPDELADAPGRRRRARSRRPARPSPGDLRARRTAPARHPRGSRTRPARGGHPPQPARAAHTRPGRDRRRSRRRRSPPPSPWPPRPSPGMSSVRHPGAPQIVRFSDASDPASLSEADAEAMRRRPRAQMGRGGTAFCWATAGAWIAPGGAPRIVAAPVPERLDGTERPGRACRG